MMPVLEAARELQTFINRRRWKFCIIGGVAVNRWGEPRFTHDVDLSLLVGLGTESRYVDALLSAFRSPMHDAKEFALQNRVLLLVASNNVPVDVSLAAFPYEEKMIARSTRFRFARGLQLTTVSAEDLVVLKALAGRDRDWADIRGVLVRCEASLDWGLIDQQMRDLRELATDANARQRLDAIREEVANA